MNREEMMNKFKEGDFVLGTDHTVLKIIGYHKRAFSAKTSADLEVFVPYGDNFKKSYKNGDLKITKKDLEEQERKENQAKYII